MRVSYLLSRPLNIVGATREGRERGTTSKEREQSITIFAWTACVVRFDGGLSDSWLRLAPTRGGCGKLIK